MLYFSLDFSRKPNKPEKENFLKNKHDELIPKRFYPFLTRTVCFACAAFEPYSLLLHNWKLIFQTFYSSFFKRLHLTLKIVVKLWSFICFVWRTTYKTQIKSVRSLFQYIPLIPNLRLALDGTLLIMKGYFEVNSDRSSRKLIQNLIKVSWIYIIHLIWNANKFRKK